MLHLTNVASLIRIRLIRRKLLFQREEDAAEGEKE